MIPIWILNLLVFSWFILVLMNFLIMKVIRMVYRIQLKLINPY
jgi:hypothetical protein